MKVQPSALFISALVDIAWRYSSFDGDVYYYAETSYEKIKFLATIMGIIIWDFLMFDQIFLSPQAKQSVITSVMSETSFKHKEG